MGPELVVAVVSAPIAAIGVGVAYRQYRHQRSKEVEPDLQIEHWTEVSSGASTVPRGEPIWALRLKNIGAVAKDVRLCVFTKGSVVHDRLGQTGLVEQGESWDLVLDQTPAHEDAPIQGFALARADDGWWYARSLDGRGSRFRREPSDTQVLQAFTLAIPSDPLQGRMWSKRVADA